MASRAVRAHSFTFAFPFADYSQGDESSSGVFVVLEGEVGVFLQVRKSPARGVNSPAERGRFTR
eukprot:740785-Prorocentrum_minimum.AAC.2